MHLPDLYWFVFLLVPLNAASYTFHIILQNCSQTITYNFQKIISIWEFPTITTILVQNIYLTQ